MSEITEAAVIELVKAATDGSTEMAQYVIGTLAEGHYVNGVVGMTIAGIVVLILLVMMKVCIKEYKKEKAANECTEGTCIVILFCAIMTITTLCVGGVFVQGIFAPESVALSQIIYMIDTY